EVGRQVVEIGVVLLRYDDDVAAADRMDVEETEDAVGFMDDVRRDRFRADPAEEATGGIVPARFPGRLLGHLALLWGIWLSSSSGFIEFRGEHLRNHRVP